MAKGVELGVNERVDQSHAEERKRGGVSKRGRRHLGQQVRGFPCNAFENQGGFPVQVGVLYNSKEKTNRIKISQCKHDHYPRSP